jgi:hypothetical protein
VIFCVLTPRSIGDCYFETLVTIRNTVQGQNPGNHNENPSKAVKTSALESCSVLLTDPVSPFMVINVQISKKSSYNKYVSKKEVIFSSC